MRKIFLSVFVVLISGIAIARPPKQARTLISPPPERLAIINARLVTPYQITDGATILVENGTIVYVGKDAPTFWGATVIDANGRYASAGFIDTHCHGGGGDDFSDGTVEAMLGAARMHAEHGTTLIYPSTASCSNEILFDVFDTYRKADAINTQGARFGGIHIEGNFLSTEMSGGQDKRYVRNPTPADYNAILERGGDIIKRWTFAPELEGAKEFMVAVAKYGIQLSVGHTAALYEETIDAFERGATSITHFYSMTSTVTRRNALRYAGTLEAGYLSDDIYVETIGDGVHLPAPLLKLIYKVKGPSRMVGVTDAMRGAGMPEGPTTLGSLKDGQPAIIEDGVAKLMDRSSFAGSVCTADRIVRTYITIAEIPLTHAIQIVTLTPAQMMGIDGKKGLLAAGKDADIVLFDENINVSTTIIGGKVVFNLIEN